MSDAFWEHLAFNLVAAGTVVSTMIGLWNNRKIEKVHQATNSMKDALVKVTGESEFARGHLQGVQERRVENAGDRQSDGL